MKNLIALAIAGGIAYWLFIRPKTVIPPATGGPAQTTGAPQPQGVQAYPRAVVDVYDLQAYPMGSFSGR